MRNDIPLENEIDGQEDVKNLELINILAYDIKRLQTAYRLLQQQVIALSFYLHDQGLSQEEEEKYYAKALDFVEKLKIQEGEDFLNGVKAPIE